MSENLSQTLRLFTQNQLPERSNVFERMSADIDPAALCSIEAEQALLGAILNSAGAAFDVAECHVAADDFYEPIHKLLFEQFATARASGRAITLTLATAALGPMAKATIFGGVTVRQYVAHLAAEATTIVNAPDFAKTIREFSERRKILSVLDILRDGVATVQNPAELATAGIELLDELATSRLGAAQTRISIGKAATDSIRRMTWAMQNPGKISGVSWGISDLDAKTNGLQRGEVIVLAGRPGMGKTGLAISCARQSANAGNTVLYFSLEMTARALSDRILADMCFDTRDPLAYWNIANGQLTNAQAERVVDAERELQSLPLKIEEQSRLTVSQITARSRKHKLILEQKGMTLDVVIIDHMHLVCASDRYAGNRVSEVAEISGALKAMAKELNVPVLALAQLSRQVENRDDKRPMLSDLRDSGAIEQDADLVMFLYREAYYLERTTASDPATEDIRVARFAEVSDRLEAIIAKQRNGPTGTVKLFFDAPSNAARNLPRAA